MENKIFIGIGSNLGDSLETIKKTIEVLKAEKSIDFISTSSIYLTKAIGYENQPDFMNAVFFVKSNITPLTLLKKLLTIEDQFGRVRTFKNAPRCIDLDLLIYGNFQIKIQGPTPLTLPHPEIHKRAFVLKPLVEINPNCEIPGLGRAKNYLKACKKQEISLLNVKLNI